MLPNKKYKNDYNDDIQNYDNNLYDNHDNHNHGNINYTHYAQNHINLIRIYWTEVILVIFLGVLQPIPTMPTLCVLFFQEKHKLNSKFLSVLHTDMTEVVEIIFLWKTRTYLFYIVNIMCHHDIDLVKPGLLGPTR